jgi:hypothetical protein
MESQLPEVIPVAPKVLRQNLRDAVEDVFWDLGGPAGMMDWVKESTANKRIFFKDILPKLIPKQLNAEFGGAGGGPMKLVIEWQGEVPASAAATALMGAVQTAVAFDEDP